MALDNIDLYLAPFYDSAAPFPEIDINGDGTINLYELNYASSNYPIMQNYYYSPFGELWQGERSTDTNPFRYAGEYYDKETGSIYLRARYYNPSIGRFISIDPIKDGTNWYVYCSNNPIKFVDPSGLKLTKEEAAAIANHIYQDIPLCDPNDPEGNYKLRTVAGWILIDVFDGGATSSVKMGVYIPEGDDLANPSEYVFAFRGSTTNFDDLETWSVWANNILAYGSSTSVDMWAAIGVGICFDATHSQEITFVGHSKGGGEAIAAATATNNNAITFNAANFNFANYGLLERNKSRITNYYIDGEILSSLIRKSRYGTNIPVKTEYWKEYSFGGFNVKIPDHIKNHSMDAFRDA